MRRDSKCPVAAAIAVVGGKWKPSILLQLKDGPCHFNELRRRLPHVTQRVLTLQLRSLERDGIITRKQAGGNPPRVEYSFSAKGRTLGQALHELEIWGEHHLL